jgi:radical SAM protein with 4Fe4S-binding SPASM domain
MNYPSYIQLYPTLRCNQSCSFCFNRNVKSNLYRDMNAEYAYMLSDMLKKIGIFEIDILGGEPMLIPWIKDFAEYATGSGIALNISTNGSLPDIVEQFKGIRTNYLNVGFSIQGFSKTHNALTMSNNFSKAITGLERMIATGKNPIVKSILLQENVNEIYGLVSYLAELGLRKYYLLHEDIIGRKKSVNCFSFPEFWKFYSNLKADMKGILNIGFVTASGFYEHGSQPQGRCDAGAKKIAILPDGSVFPCNLFAGFGEFCIGNIFKDGIEKIWGSPILEPFRRSNRGNTCMKINCDHYLTCRGGCPAHSYYFYGTLDMADSRCKI